MRADGPGQERECESWAPAIALQHRCALEFPSSGVGRASKVSRLSGQEAVCYANCPESSVERTNLEDGIAVRFGEGEYRTGDYWLIPARTGTERVAWPGGAEPEPRPPCVTEHHRCSLRRLGTTVGMVGACSPTCGQRLAPSLRAPRSRRKAAAACALGRTTYQPKASLASSLP